MKRWRRTQLLWVKLLREELKKIDSLHIAMIRGKGLLNAIVIDHRNNDAAWELCLALKENGLLGKTNTWR
jgi:ornithine--oxo-acid transaminase